jgi:Peptidase inhibitor family I36
VRTKTVLTTALSAVILFGTAAPAVAGSATEAVSGDCSLTNTVCLFEGENYTGERFTVSSWPPGSGACVSLVDHGWGDRAHSAINTNSTSAAMFMNDDCLGGPFQIPPNTGLPSFGGFTPESIWVP